MFFHRECHVGLAFHAGVLHYDIHADIGLGERLEQAGGVTGAVNHAPDGDFGNVGVGSDAANLVPYLSNPSCHRLFLAGLYIRVPGASVKLEATRIGTL